MPSWNAESVATVSLLLVRELHTDLLRDTFGRYASPGGRRGFGSVIRASQDAGRWTRSWRFARSSPTNDVRAPMVTPGPVRGYSSVPGASTSWPVTVKNSRVNDASWSLAAKSCTPLPGSA